MSVSCINRSPTRIIRPTSEKHDNISQNSLAIIRICYCSKVISPGHVDILERKAPYNDEVQFFYKKHKYEVLVSGRGVFYLGKTEKDELILVKDKKINDFPCCDTTFRHLTAFV